MRYELSETFEKMVIAFRKRLYRREVYWSENDRRLVLYLISAYLHYRKKEGLKNESAKA